MNSPDAPRSAYGRERLCQHCGTRVAQRASTCFNCGASLQLAPKRRRFAIPWADIILFSVIGGLIALWWTRSPEAPDGQRISLVSQSATRVAATATGEPAGETAVFTPPPTLTPRPSSTRPPAETPTPEPPSEPVKHKVKPGDTLIAIAAAYDTSVKDIADANSMKANGLLRIGQELLIPVSGPSGGPGPTATAEGSALMYVVQPGDTISTIAVRYNSQTNWIMEANNIKSGDVLHIGRALLVPLTANTPTPTPTPENTPTPEPTTGPRLPAPMLLAPSDGAVLIGNNAVLLTWAATGTLAADEWYVVTVKAVEVDKTIPPYWTKTTSWRLPAEYRVESQAPTEFTWQVQVRQGSEDDPGDPSSAQSAQYRFAWR